MRLSFAIQLSSALLLAASAWAVEVKTATHLSSYTWRHSADWFGGFSALQVSDNGRQIVVLSDSAVLARAVIERDGDEITGVRFTGDWPVLSSKGRPMSGKAGDSEGIAVAPDGSYYISFEALHRVAWYAASDAKAVVLPRPEAFENLSDNGSLEALAIDDKGWLYTLPEKSRTKLGKIPVYRWDGQAWSTPFVLPQRGNFLPVSADFGPDGRFYVLERSLSLIGFRTRLRRWQITEDGAEAEETLFESGTGTHDNLEGLSVWRDDQGRLRATMVSDDNFMILQRTELVEYLLPD
ncbi:esterase-like activity of phytase family protein [Ruegeria sp. SCP11]|uniref:esterase-like activity of phytase family protein n=1 Tax=Ruegeria sp. SCP11 TaxID=3141378 RepID=UPI00333CE1FD